jgi:hypothetical protein
MLAQFDRDTQLDLHRVDHRDCIPVLTRDLAINEELPSAQVVPAGPGIRFSARFLSL